MASIDPDEGIRTRECTRTVPASRLSPAYLCDAYLAAQYQARPQWQRVALRVGAPAAALEACLPGTPCFGMLSACNPGSHACAPGRNRTRQASLRLALAARGLRALPGLASDADGRWREAHWLVPGIPPDTLDALALCFGQLGTLYWQRGQPVRLRMAAARPAGWSAVACVDWLQ